MSEIFWVTFIRNKTLLLEAQHVQVSAQTKFKSRENAKIQCTHLKPRVAMTDQISDKYRL